MDKYGRIDAAFNVPGINIRKEALDLTYEGWDKVLRINLDGMTWVLAAEWAPYIRVNSIGLCYMETRSLSK
jgi:NAD(P)-dependent dehydrogenase (short-subunit alcohol dehydrogenase family)